MLSVYAALLVLAAGALDPITLQRRPAGHRVFVDSAGRERLFHGTNAVVKGPPWVPDPTQFSPDISMAREDFEWMSRLGLNVLRLGVFWSGVEPLRGQYNQTYLDLIDQIVQQAAQHGVYTFFDWHQDGLSEHFCGEGVPSWAVRRSALPRLFGFPSPFSRAFNETELYVESRLPGQPSIPRRSACAKEHGPGWGEGTREAARAYQAIYSNWDGLGDALAAAWAVVARRFAHRPEVLGLELLNEPFAGDLYEHPGMMVPYPNPLNADATNLQPLYDRIHSAVRAVDDQVLLFFAGTTWDDLGVGFTAPPGGQEYANRSVIAYHYYHPPQMSVEMQFSAYAASARRLSTGSFMTESDHAPGREIVVGDIGDGADAALQSWAFWEWKNFYRGADSGSDSQLAAYGAAKTGNAGSWPGTAPSDDFQKGLARTYARAVAGQAVLMRFNLTDASFELEYIVTAESLAHPTEIYIWPERYIGGAAVEAMAVPGGSMRVDYDGTGSEILIYPTEAVKPGAQITVRVNQK